MAKAYIPKDIFGNPIPEDALLDEIRSRHGGGSLPQSETQRLVSELDLSAREEETWKSLREDEERRIKALGKREENLNWALDRVITDSLRGFGKQRHTTYEENGTVIQSFKDDPDWEQYVEDIKEDIFLDVGRAAARFTEWDYTKYKGGKEWIKKERDALLQRLLTEYGLPENIAESIVAGALGVGKLFHERELDIHRQRIQLGDDVEAAVSGHINIKDPDDPSVQYGAGVSAGDLFGIKGFDAEVEAKGDLADQIIRQVEGSVGYQDEGFSASVGASGDPTRPEYGRVEGELETQDLLGAGERINVGVTGYPLREHPSARFDIDAGVPLGPGYLSGQTSGTITEGPTYLSGQYEVPLGPGRLTAGASTDLGDEIAANVRYKVNLNKGGIVDLQTNETASEVLAQSNTKTPDFMAPVLLPNPPKPDNSQAERSAINRQQYLEDEVLAGRPPPGEEWPDEKYLATSELLERSVLPGGERDPLLNPGRPRTVDAENPTPIKNSAFFGEPVPVTDAEYMMREAGRFPNRQNPLALIGRDATLEKTATADMRDVTARGVYTRPGTAYEDLSPESRYLIRKSDRPELVDDPGGSVITAAETFDEEFGPQVIVEGTPTHEWMHAGLGRIRQADPDFKLPQFPSEYGDRFSDNLNEEMWVRLIHAHTEDLSAIPMTEPLTIDGEEQFDDDGFVRQEIVKTKTNDDKSLLRYTGGDTDYWLSQPSVISGINSILEKANEVGRELGSFDVTETPSDRAQFAPGGQRRYEGTEISARQPFQEGGIASLPKNPVLAGQEHMLAYITPEEASTLRAQGGGVTPDGGQRRGPGGIASFGWATSSGAAGMGFGGTGTGHGGRAAGPGSEGGSTAAGGVGDPGGPGPGRSGVVGQSVLGTIDGSYSKALYGDRRNQLSPELISMIDNDPFGYAQSGAKKNAVDQAIASGHVDLSVTGKDFDAPFGYVSGLTPEQAASPFNIPAQDRVNIGDATGLFGQLVRGLGTTALGMLAPALRPATMAIDLLGDTGLMNWAGVPEIAGDVSQEIGLGRDPLGAVGEAIGDAAGYIGEKTGLSDIDSGAAAKSLGFSGEPSPYAERPSNLGPGISLPPPAGIPSVEIGLQVPPTTVTETLEDATSSDYTAQQLADATGATLAQAREYLESRYA
jgi:hypothetical protein